MDLFRRAFNMMLKLTCAMVCMVCALASVCGAAQDDAPSVTKVEPPSWWSKQNVNPVRLLVRGTNFRDAQVRATQPELQPSAVVINRKGTYLLVDVRISPIARPGPYTLVIETPHGKTTIPFRIESPLDSKTNFQGITNDDVIYLIMIDRFANGDPDNDIPAGAPREATDRGNPRAYHGGDLRGIINHLSYLKSLGVTALWLTPWYDNWNGMNSCDKPWCPNTYYHGYHAIDYYTVEDRFGDLATLRELIEKAHSLGFKVIQDQVANHVGSQHPWVKDSPRDDWFHGTLAHHQLNKFGNSVLLSPHSNAEEVRNTLDGWFNDDLPDMNQDEPEVARYEIQNALWWVGVTGIDGIRQDTIQYMPRPFIRDLANALHRQYPRMWMVGEVFERDAAQTAFFIGGHTGWDGVDTKLDSDFDFSLWNTSLFVFTNKLPVRSLRDQLKYDALYPNPMRVTTPGNNHDNARFMSLEGATIEGAMMHVAFTLSVRGIPQLYYGEEIAMEGKDDPDNRRDFPGGFPVGPMQDSRSAFEPSGRTPREQQMFDWTRSWIRLRTEHPAIRGGRLIDLFYDDDAYVFARQDQSETVIIAFNRQNHARQINVPVASIGVRDGADFRSLIGSAAGIKVVRGQVSLTIPARTAIALKAG
jgi:neopullulanase